jgi:hypothetical protein
MSAGEIMNQGCTSDVSLGELTALVDSRTVLGGFRDCLNRFRMFSTCARIFSGTGDPAGLDEMSVLHYSKRCVAYH